MNEPSRTERPDSENVSAKNHIIVIHESQTLDGRFPKTELLEEAFELTTLDISEDHLVQFLSDNNLPNSLSEYYDDDVLQDPSNLIADSSCEHSSEPTPAAANSPSEPLAYSGRSTPYSRLNMNEPASTSERHDSENDLAKNQITVIHESLQTLDGRFPKAEMLEEACEITTLDISEDHLVQFLSDNNLPNSLSEYYDDVLQDPSNLIADSSCEHSSEPTPAAANSPSEPLAYSGRSTPYSRLNMNEPASTSERHDSENDLAKNQITVIHESLQTLDGRFPKAEMLEEACEITTLDLSEDHLFQFLADNNLPNSLSEYYDDVLQDPSNLIAERSSRHSPALLAQDEELKALREKIDLKVKFFNNNKGSFSIKRIDEMLEEIKHLKEVVKREENSKVGPEVNRNLLGFETATSNRLLVHCKGEHFLSVAPKFEESTAEFLNVVRADHTKPRKSDIGNAVVNNSAISTALSNLHSELKSRPKETDSEVSPSSLTVNLLSHQERALKWMLWRESSAHVAGGILADDMGLGKTLSMIALIVRQKELNQFSGVTLVVCPKVVVDQWKTEVERFSFLRVLVIRGTNRKEVNVSELKKFDIVITSYKILLWEIFLDAKAERDNAVTDSSVFLKLKFARIVLDEGHKIRNHKTETAEAVFKLEASCRWVLSGTPIQNTEMDLFSLFKFLRVSPFDQLEIWKIWIDSTPSTIKGKNEKNSQECRENLLLLVKTFLLRRTKYQKVAGTETPIVILPSREVHTHLVHLSSEESDLYQNLFSYSRRQLEQYIYFQETKEGRKNITEFREKKITKHVILILLLRLRQACSHPALISTMLDDDSVGGKDSLDFPFTPSNPIFDRLTMSSKMKLILEKVQEVVRKQEKSLVISQWVTMLEIIAGHLHVLKIRSRSITGQVKDRERSVIIKEYNEDLSGPPVLLLSLCAGGEGLNLIGGNHVFLTDLHWNPHLEAQACDRVYRVAQKKNVHVHRFIAKETIEEKIFSMQKSKLSTASSLLSSGISVLDVDKELNLSELKDIFNIESSQS